MKCIFVCIEIYLRQSYIKHITGFLDQLRFPPPGYPQFPPSGYPQYPPSMMYPFWPAPYQYPTIGGRPQAGQSGGSDHCSDESGRGSSAASDPQTAPHFPPLIPEQRVKKSFAEVARSTSSVVQKGRGNADNARLGIYIILLRITVIYTYAL